MSDKDSKIPLRVVERGGIGLVTWHLARAGIEAVTTGPNSLNGDLWVQIPRGPIVRIEVKTGTKPAWHLPKAQIARAEFFIFVHLKYGRCWIVSAEQIKHNLHNYGTRDTAGTCYIVKDDKLPREALNAWHLLTQRKTNIARTEPRYASKRVVRHILRDGTEKVYTYPKFIAAKKSQNDNSINLTPWENDLKRKIGGGELF